MSSGEQLAFAQEDNVLAAPPTGCLVCMNSKAHQRADRYMNSEYRRVKWQPGCDGMRFGTVDGVLVCTCSPPPPPRHRIDKLSLVNRGDGVILTEFKLFPQSNSSCSVTNKQMGFGWKQ